MTNRHKDQSTNTSQSRESNKDKSTSEVDNVHDHCYELQLNGGVDEDEQPEDLSPDKVEYSTEKHDRRNSRKGKKKEKYWTRPDKIALDQKRNDKRKKKKQSLEIVNLCKNASFNA